MSLDRTIQKRQLSAQLVMAMLRQGLYEIFQHRTQPTHDLDASRTAMTYFGAGELHKVLPVRCPENDSQFAGGIADLFTAELLQTDPPKQTVKLVDGEYRRRRIIDKPVTTP